MEQRLLQTLGLRAKPAPSFSDQPADNILVRLTITTPPPTAAITDSQSNPHSDMVGTPLVCESTVLNDQTGPEVGVQPLSATTCQ